MRISKQISITLTAITSFAAPLYGESSLPERPREVMGMHVTTPTGTGFLAGFSVTGPTATVKSLENRLISFHCPTPMIRAAGSEQMIFAPFSNRCDKSPTLALLQDIQSGKFPELHALDVQFFPAPSN